MGSSLSTAGWRINSPMPLPAQWTLLDVTEQPLSEELFPHTQPEPPLTHLHAIPSRPITVTKEKRSVLLLCSPHQEAVAYHEAFPSASSSLA